MIRARLPWLLVPIACGVAGCIVVVQAPPSTSRPATLPPAQVSVTTLSPSPAPTPTPIGIAITENSPPLSPTPPPVLDTPVPATLPTAPPLSASVPISITSFTVSPPEIRPGDPVTLTWSVIAEQVTIWRLDALGRLSVSYIVPISGSLVVTPPEELRNQVAFVLFADSGASSAQAFVSARISCPDEWFFPNPPGACPASPPHYTALQAEHFEHGIMLWTQFDDFIHLLYFDGRSPQWEAMANAWFEGMPLNDPNIVPPPGFFQPVRGFGLTWRTGYVSPNQVVRDRLGWATDEEFPVGDAAYQCDAAPKYSTCYLTGPGNVVIVLQPERSGWFVWTGPTPTP